MQLLDSTILGLWTDCSGRTSIFVRGCISILHLHLTGMCLSSQCGRVLVENRVIIIEYQVIAKRKGEYMVLIYHLGGRSKSMAHISFLVAV